MHMHWLVPDSAVLPSLYVFSQSDKWHAHLIYFNYNQPCLNLRADWKERGFLDAQRDALFDICILNADASSLEKQNLQPIFDTRKEIQKEKYGPIAELKRASFTPIIATCEAIFDKEAEVYMKRLATILSKKWQSNSSRAVCYTRARMHICIHRCVSLRIRGSRTKCRGVGIVDSAAIPLNILELELDEA